MPVQEKKHSFLFDHIEHNNSRRKPKTFQRSGKIHTLSTLNPAEKAP
jgi:hypothetical protein